MQNFSKNIDKMPNFFAKFKYFTFDLLGGVKGGEVELWHCHAYLQTLGNHGV